MSVRSCEAITDLLASTDVVQFKDIQTALDHASRATAFRYLKQVPYQRIDFHLINYPRPREIKIAIFCNSLIILNNNSDSDGIGHS